MGRGSLGAPLANGPAELWSEVEREREGFILAGEKGEEPLMAADEPVSVFLEAAHRPCWCMHSDWKQ